MRSLAIGSMAALLLAACAQTGDPAPTPLKPSAPTFKEAPPGWAVAAPADAQPRGPWWTAFGDPALNALAERVAASNQTVAAAAAAVAQAQALVREQRAGLWPTLSASGGYARSGGGANAAPGDRFTLGLQAGWEPDLWGRVGGGITAAGARAQAGGADLAAAVLAAQAEAATAYFNLRFSDAVIELLRATITAYERAARITSNRYDAGIALKSDLLQAQTQLANAQADLAAAQQQRAGYEHALAVLVGEAPADFSLPADAGTPAAAPAVPGLLPSTLLQRRPDIAGAERRVAAANADIGVARTAYFPSLAFSGDASQGAPRVADLFSASATAWSLGLSLVQTVFDGGLRTAQVDAARAAWQQAVAQYRQTVLAAFQDVEDQLAAQRWLALQARYTAQAADAATQTQAQVLNRYNAGQVSYSEVVLAQVTALTAQRASLQIANSQRLAAVGLVRAIGGGWQGL